MSVSNKMSTIVSQALDAKRFPNDQETLEQIKNSDLPLVLWGSAKFAKHIFRILEKDKISVSAVFVDNPKVGETFEGHLVCTFEDVIAKFGQIDILLAHGERSLIPKYSNNENVNKVFTIFDFQCLGFSYERKFLESNADVFNGIWNDLSDEFSKKSFEAYIKSRVSNNFEHIQEFVTGNQYFQDFINFTNSEIVIDCGAYTGDTLLEFSDLVKGEFKKYFALEPSDTNAKIMADLIVENAIENVEIIKKGAWNEHAYFSFLEDTDTSHMNIQYESPGENTIEVDKIDLICDSNATFIKMDIEGAELMALKGASETISKNKPKLALAIYHRTEDLITIPKYLKELRPDYKFYFRLHNKIGTDAVLYAI